LECKCGESFLPHLLPQHQRSCEACRPAVNEGPDENGFVPCQWCSRRFFPDRLPVHLRVCKSKPADAAGGIRPTITSAETMVADVGAYDADPARRRRLVQLGAAVAAGWPLT